MVFCWLEAMLTNRFHKKNKKTTQIQAWYKILETEILRYEEFHHKTT